MQNFADQCLDMAQSILSHNLNSINPEGFVSPVDHEKSRSDEPGHAALAIGEYYRHTGQVELAGYDLIDLAARCITAQAFSEDKHENGIAYSALGLLSFGPSKERNIVWERLLEPTREQLDRQLLTRSDYQDHFQVFNIAKSVARFSMGLSKNDETGKLIDRFLTRIEENSSNLFFDNHPEGLGGNFNIYGVMSFVFIRQALQLHSNIHLRERKMPSLRTYAEKYIKLIPHLVRHDGLGWSYGSAIGAYGQMHCISLILQALRDNWIPADKEPLYFDLLRRLFHYFFTTYLDQEHGYLVIRDAERNTISRHTTRMANFDAARYLCQWSRLAKAISKPMVHKPSSIKTFGHYVGFDKSFKKEQGVFIYQNGNNGLHLQLPLVSGGLNRSCDYLAFPHCPGIFDWPVNRYLPILLPELTFGEHVIVPSFYGKRCTTGLGLRNALYFQYEQPDLITKDEKIISGLGSCKVTWSFLGDKITSEFVFTMKQQYQLDSMRYFLALGTPHSQYRNGSSLVLGDESLRAIVLHDDFQAKWLEPSIISDDPDYCTYTGKLHYLQVLQRDYPLIMRPGKQYKLVISFEPDVRLVDE